MVVGNHLSGSIFFTLQSSKNGISKTQSAGNQRPISSLVETSETLRAATFPKSLCEWLAGVIDGDGSLQLSKKGYTSLEITMGLEDLPLLQYIQHKLGGSIKLRSGGNSYRYRIHDKKGMTILINCINGNIRHSARLLQLHRVCLQLNIPVIQPVLLTYSNNWFAGFFDADGTIGISMKDLIPQLSIRVGNKNLVDIEWYQKIFGGYIYFDTSKNGYYIWSIQSRKDIAKFQIYFKSSIFRSSKSKRFFLIDKYYDLKDLKAYKETSIHHKEWLSFMENWEKLNI
jgi:hypothetical protein